MIKDDGTTTTTLKEIHDQFLSFYLSLLGTKDEVFPIDATICDLGLRVSTTQAEFLVQQFSNEEIKVTLFDIRDDKSPGSDGYTSTFFKKTWNAVGNDFCEVVAGFFSTGLLLKQTKHAIVFFIPKKEHSNSVGDFRPISYCNVFYKVIINRWPRLGEILPCIINDAQFSFVKV